MVSIQTPVPIISFTFDDAPRTAFTAGGYILESFGARATFFVSLGLLGTTTEVGLIANLSDLSRAIMTGHELGCHTFDHFDTWEVPARQFVRSVLENGQVLSRILPGTNFKTFSYPKNEPNPSIKFYLEKHFACCRGGGQTSNVGKADLNLLKAFFLDRRNMANINEIKQLINYNTSYRGWLIFATHDIADNPSPYGCTPQFFDEVVKYAAHSGSLLLTVENALEQIQASAYNPTI